MSVFENLTVVNGLNNSVVSLIVTNFHCEFGQYMQFYNRQFFIRTSNFELNTFCLNILPIFKLMNHDINNVG